MSDEKTDGTTAARSKEPIARPYETGLSTPMKERLRTIGIDKSIKQRIADHLEKKAAKPNVVERLCRPRAEVSYATPPLLPWRTIGLT